MKNMVAIIPARGGSKGLPRKNLRELGGMPLIAWTIKAAKECPLINSVIVTSDDPEILSVSAQYGADELVKRPAKLATDDATTADCVRHVFSEIPKSHNFALLQPTSPLRDNKILTESIRFFFDSNALSIVSVTESSESPYWTFKVVENKLIRVIETIEPIDQRQKLPKTFILNGAIYLWNTEYFLESGDFITGKTLAFQMPRGLSIDIDTLEDFEEASNRLDRLTLQEKNRTSE